jgi:hypothetical protein
MANADTIVVNAERITGTTAALSNIQSFTLNSGRRNIDDNYRAGRATLIGRVPSSLPTLALDDYIRITLQTKVGGVNGSAITYDLRVTDLEIEYGTVAAADTWTITLEDAFGLLGRALVSLSVSAGTLTTTAAEDVCEQIPEIGFFAPGTATTTKTNAATFTDANALDAFQTYANTEWAFVLANGNGIRWFTRNSWVQTAQTITFADNGTGDLEYQTLTFNSLSEAIADKVVVNVRGGSQSTAGTGAIGLEIDSYSESASEATNLANYVKAVFDNDTPTPFQLSYQLTKQDDFNCLVPVDPNYPKKVVLTLRGSSYTAFVLGFGLSANPDMVRATLYLLPANAVEFLILDDATFGRLDFNKLGY